VTLWLGIAVLALVVAFVLAAPLFGDPYKIYADGLGVDGLPVGVGTPGHPLGTDEIGRDMLTRAAWGGRQTLKFTFIANLTSMALGAIVGVIAGFYRGWVEQILMRITDIFLSVPTAITGLALASIFGTGISGLVIVITVLYWAWTARLVFGETLALRRRAFVEAAVASGVGGLTIVRRHILPHLGPMLLTVGALNGASVVSIGAGLSYLGAGMQPPTPEWGSMLEEGQDAFQYAPQMLLVPLACIVLTVLSFVLLAEALARRGQVSLRRSWLDT
jgi:ABC-type dipeptide/oligopeptide/nickel transport system permease subunit